MTLLGREYAKEAFTSGGITNDVYTRGAGPAVLLLHELPGLAEPTVQFAERLVTAGYTVTMPHLFGPILSETGPRILRTIEASTVSGINYAKLCVSSEFARLRGNTSAPITNWLRALTKHLSERTEGGRVGAIGMCLTGGYVIALAIDPWVAATVTSQPAIPLTVPPGSMHHASELSISEAELQAAAARGRDGEVLLIGFRFTGDRKCPAARLERLREAFGPKCEMHEYPSPDPAHRIDEDAHSVLTNEYEHAEGADATHPTRLAQARVLEFLGARLRAASA
jgi:dienelactone hydrolase